MPARRRQAAEKQEAQQQPSNSRAEAHVAAASFRAPLARIRRLPLSARGNRAGRPLTHCTLNTQPQFDACRSESAGLALGGWRRQKCEMRDLYLREP
jgi:hypothetical protein